MAPAALPRTPRGGFVLPALRALRSLPALARRGSGLESRDLRSGMLQPPPRLGAVDPCFDLARTPGAPLEGALGAALAELDRFGVSHAGIDVDGDPELARAALAAGPGRFFARTEADPRRGMAELRRLEALARAVPLRLVTLSPARLRVPLDDARCFPLYAKCVELGLALAACVGVPRERLPFAPQRPERIDRVACAFPELALWLRGDCSPWPGLAPWLMRRHPNLAHASARPCPELLAFAADDGAHQLVFASGPATRAERERFYKALPELPLPARCARLFARDNAARILKLR
jgi:predicted TIM-barrel fold metal-dependent hydrolase